MPCRYLPEKNPRIWEKARSLAKQEMIAKGWNILSKKFREFQNKKAIKIYGQLINT